MARAIIFDTEFLTAPGAPQRFWCGPEDPDRQVVQIGAVALSLEPPFDFDDTFDRIIAARDRHGTLVRPTELMTRLTGITGTQIAAGVSLHDALAGLADFAAGARLWSWGKDEIEMIALSCWIEGIAPPMAPAQFGNATTLIQKAGQSLDVIHQTRSTTLAALYGLEQLDKRDHDAVSDAMGVAITLQHLLREKALAPEDLL